MKRRSRHKANTNFTLKPGSNEAGQTFDALYPTAISATESPNQNASQDSTPTRPNVIYITDNQRITPPDNHDLKSKHKNFLKLCCKAAGVTALAFLLSFLLSSPFAASISALFSPSEKSDFNMTDLFFQIADNRPVRTFENRFAILDIGNLNRLEIAELLDMLALCEPKAVAIDVNFETATENDSLLLNTLSHLPALVLPVGVEQEGDRFRLVDKPFFYGKIPGIEYGVVNFPTSHRGGTVREFAHSFPMSDGKTLLSFPEAAAKAGGLDPAISPASAEDVPTGIISYHSKEITVIPHDDLADRLEELHDKIVLVGTTTEAGDIYSTPLSRGVSGLEIHAYALSTILDGSKLKKMPVFIGNIIAIVLCFLMVLGAIGIKTGIKGLVLRLAQIISLYFLVWGGYSMLVDHEIVGDFSQAILMVAFGLFSADLWNGTEALIKWIKQKFKKRRAGTSQPSNQ